MMSTPPRVERRTVIVTGCSSGLGLETAVYLAERGFRVCATMRDIRKRERLDREAGRRGVALDVLPLDVTNEPAVRAAIDSVADRYGDLYGVVNNAGVLLRGFFEDLGDDEIRQVFETNVFGTMAVTRAVLPHLRRAGRGRVVIISSIGGRLGSPALTAYCGSKFALEGFGEALVQEVQPLGVHVSLVAPAMIVSEMWRGNRGLARGSTNPASPYHDSFLNEERWADEWLASSPTQPADVADAVYSALTVDRPPLRYVVGKRAARVLALRSLLPGELFERFYFGLTLRHTTPRS
jgi:NAD(P)-dependent dehydrogenase (short-subunit alcohol dehydrogenase family)